MGWVYLDDHFFDHEKVILAGGDAALVYVAGLAYANRQLNGGVIPKSHVARLTDRKSPQRLAKKLCDVKLWVEEDDHYRIWNYDRRNRTAQARREKAQKAARARWEHPPSNAPSIPASNAPPMPDGMPSSPVPNVLTSSSNSRRLAAVPKDDDGLDPFWRFWAKADLKAYKRECSVPIRSEVGFLERAASRRREWHEDEVRSYLAEHPTSPFPEVIDAVTHVDRAAKPTAPALCGECSNGWIESAAGVVRCECRRTA